jgi:hypothetical protein
MATAASSLCELRRPLYNRLPRFPEFMPNPLPVPMLSRATYEARHVDEKAALWASFGRRKVDPRIVVVVRFTAMDSSSASGNCRDRAAAHSQSRRNFALRQFPFLQKTLNFFDE